MNAIEVDPHSDSLHNGIVKPKNVGNFGIVESHTDGPILDIISIFSIGKYTEHPQLYVRQFLKG